MKSSSMKDLSTPANAQPTRKRNTPCPSSSTPSRPDPFPRNPEPVVPGTESVEALLGANRYNASRISSIKDLRMRRVFTPGVNSVLGEVDDDAGTEDRKKLSSGSESCRLECKSERKTAVNGHRRRRVFKTSSSFSYRRLLPYMMDILNDDENVPEIEIVDVVVPCKLQKVDCVKSQKKTFAENICTAKVKFGLSQLNDTTSPSQNESGAQNFRTKMPFDWHGVAASAESETGQPVEITTPSQPKQHPKVCESGVDRVDDSVGNECVQTTPPDPDIFSNAETGQVGDEPMEKKHKQIKGSEKSSVDVLRQSLSSKRDTNSINRPVLNPCSRLRLFDNTKSLSYRRLLPFLISTYQNNHCDSRITQQPMPQVNLKKDTVGKKYMNGIKTDNSYEKQLTEDQTQNVLASVVSVPPENNNNNNNNPVFSMPQSSSTKHSSNGELILVTPETLFEPSMRQIDLHTDKMPQCLSVPRKFDLCFDGKEGLTTLLPIPSFPISNNILNKQSSSKESAPVGKPNNPLDKGVELHNNNAEPTDRFDLKRSSFQGEACAPMVFPANVSLRGILKRNRRGCRGLCNCLNCTSFRLHADRAFEFSRNQMQDAEEVASGLMKELANMRFLLEKSITSDNDRGAIPLNPVLVKEACYKSLEAETLAKECLSQLNNDLDIHCRIPNILEPKVTFANHIQERAIPLLDPLSRIEKKG